MSRLKVSGGMLPQNNFENICSEVRFAALLGKIKKEYKNNILKVLQLIIELSIHKPTPTIKHLIAKSHALGTNALKRPLMSIFANNLSLSFPSYHPDRDWDIRIGGTLPWVHHRLNRSLAGYMCEHFRYITQHNRTHSVVHSVFAWPTCVEALC